MVTIRFIAEKAEVSKSTVSRYLNDGYVSEEAAAKIAEAIKKYNFSPNDFARSLKSNVSNFIGVIIPRLNSAASTSILEGIDREGRKKDKQILISNTDQVIEKEIESLYSFEKNKVAGIIFIATVITKEHIKAINEINIPVIIVGQSHKQLTTITHDDYICGYNFARALCEFNHKDITYIGVPDYDISVGVNRKRGVLDGFREFGNIDAKFIETTHNVQDAFALGREVFEKDDSTLYVAATDNIAIGLMKAAHSLGINVPNDISIAGFGGYTIGDYVYPSLTTVDYHFEKTGKIALTYINKLISGVSIPKKTIIDSDILYRDSVKYRE